MEVLKPPMDYLLIMGSLASIIAAIAGVWYLHAFFRLAKLVQKNTKSRAKHTLQLIKRSWLVSTKTGDFKNLLVLQIQLELEAGDAIYFEDVSDLRDEIEQFQVVDDGTITKSNALVKRLAQKVVVDVCIKKLEDKLQSLR